EPDPVAEPMPWCTIKGQPCWKEKMKMAKREAQPEPEAVAAPEPGSGKYKWCGGIKGRPCGQKAKREAQPEPEAVAAPEPANEARWCWIKGQPCWKAKRAVDAVLKAVDGEEDGAGASDGPDFDPSDFNPENFPAKRDINTHQEAKRWCWIKGQPCWKAKRAIDAALHALEN
ncbi:pheromone precursor protein 1, partial [Fusarium flagelliforme]